MKHSLPYSELTDYNPPLHPGHTSGMDKATATHTTRIYLPFADKCISRGRIVIIFILSANSYKL